VVPLVNQAVGLQCLERAATLLWIVGPDWMEWKN